jgi:hypothetical protein
MLEVHLRSNKIVNTYVQALILTWSCVYAEACDSELVEALYYRPKRR